ncbi:hypothetical protein M408DRAFT_330596 [Serendipita vermifera MAFF 305830]|uniref:F-box domain-containing protein n=1 Tax=Serendipita vermifera MAFF 305830 TaxID=933852 RepID=A0A0C3B2K4_SERVB|nr:hypothetical protein M408DRAFT_330596 [Serendipita vermifera MAFF 305830]
MEYFPQCSDHEGFESIGHPDSRGSPHNGRFVAPADRLPEELLVAIFKVLIEPSPTLIGPLLLVSRFWHHVAVTTPSMWSRIHSQPHSPDEVRRDTEYVRAAVKNSCNLPLDVTIDLQSLEYKPPPAKSSSKKLLTPTADEDPENGVTSVIDGKQENDTEQLLSELFGALVGEDGENAVRLKSIRLNNVRRGYGLIGSENAVDRFLKGLEGPTPLLESLSLHLYAIEYHFPRTGGPLQDLDSLKHLTLDAGGYLEFIKFKPETIQTLSFRLWGTTRVLSRFTGLRTLSIANWANRGVSYEADPELTFPLLECLTLRLCHPSGMIRCAGLLPHKVRAPSLTTLRLLDAEAISIVGNADAYHHVHTLDLLSSDLQAIRGFMKLHLYKYAALVNLTVFPRHLDFVKDEIRALKFQGQSPPKLNFLYTVVSDREGVIVDQQGAIVEVPSWRSANEYIYRQHSLSTCIIQ